MNPIKKSRCNIYSGILSVVEIDDVSGEAGGSLKSQWTSFVNGFKMIVTTDGKCWPTSNRLSRAKDTFLDSDSSHVVTIAHRESELRDWTKVQYAAPSSLEI